MNQLLKFLSGRKTYLVAVCFALLTFAEHSGWISKELNAQLTTLLTGAGLATLRSAIK